MRHPTHKSKRQRVSSTGCRSRRTRSSRPSRALFVRAAGHVLLHARRPRGDRRVVGPVLRAPRAIAAARSPRPCTEQMQTLDFTPPFLRAHPKAFELASRVAELTPDGINRVFFVNSGSEAVDTAMKIALMYHRVRGEGAAPALRVARACLPRRQHGRYRRWPAWSTTGGLRRRAGRACYHMRHTALPENRFARGQPEHGAELADDLLRFCSLLRRREHRGVLRRAGRRLLRLPAAAQGLPEPAARDLRRARHPAGVRRGDQRLGPDGRELRRPGLRRHARHHDHGQGDHQRRAADGRGGGAPVDLRRDHRGAAPSSGIEFFHGYTYSAHPAACAAGLAMMDIFRDERLIDRARDMAPTSWTRCFSLRDAPGRHRHPRRSA